MKKEVHICDRCKEEIKEGHIVKISIDGQGFLEQELCDKCLNIMKDKYNALSTLFIKDALRSAKYHNRFYQSIMHSLKYKSRYTNQIVLAGFNNYSIIDLANMSIGDFIDYSLADRRYFVPVDLIDYVNKFLALYDLSLSKDDDSRDIYKDGKYYYDRKLYEKHVKEEEEKEEKKHEEINQFVIHKFGVISIGEIEQLIDEGKILYEHLYVKDNKLCWDSSDYWYYPEDIEIEFTSDSRAECEKYMKENFDEESEGETSN